MLQNIIHILVLIIVFYLIGSVPTAYLLVKKINHKDITIEGSRNIGTLNAIMVSKSKSLGIIVLLLDFLKGFLPPLIFDRVFLTPNYLLILPSVFLIIGHNYSIWLKFKGGRGLAAAAGMFAFISFPVVLVWGVIWTIFRLLKRGTLFANFFATLIFFFPVYYFRNFFSQYTLFINPLAKFDYSLIILALISILILIKHAEVITRFNIFNLKKEN